MTNYWNEINANKVTTTTIDTRVECPTWKWQTKKLIQKVWNSILKHVIIFEWECVQIAREEKNIENNTVNNNNSNSFRTLLRTEHITNASSTQIPWEIQIIMFWYVKYWNRVQRGSSWGDVYFTLVRKTPNWITLLFNI